MPGPTDFNSLSPLEIVAPPPLSRTEEMAKTVVTPWGGNGMGEIIYLRDYARQIEELGRREHWPETIERSIAGIRKIGAKLTEAEEDRLRWYMLSLMGTVSGRALWQLNTKLVDQAGMDSLTNCLGGETEVVTSEGLRVVRDLAGTTPTLVTDMGKLIAAPVRSFGVQPLMAIHLTRYQENKVIRATAEHGWFVLPITTICSKRGDALVRHEIADPQKRSVRTVTKDLEAGDVLESIMGYATLESCWRVVSVEDLGVSEEVFCAIVPDTHTFSLADDLKTANCWFNTVTTPEDFRWIMDRLMVGGGVGFSVERSNVYQLPKVHKAEIEHFRAPDTDFIVPDTRRGWSELVLRVIDAHFKGESFTYSTQLVRPYGAPLKTFGGTASGPTALVEGAEKICKLMCARAGKNLRSVDVLDITNLIGEIVVAGSTRRSAQIAIGDPDDALFIKAKRWALGNIPTWRRNSNNTLVVDHYAEIADEQSFWRNFDGGSEPYGLFNRKLSQTIGRLGERRFDPSIVGLNPCGEANLAPKESCNLATIWLPKVRTFDDFTEISRILYKVQKAIALLPHPDAGTVAIVHKNLRLGQNVTGILQASGEQRDWLSPGYDALRAFDKQWSRELGVNESVRLTVVQPGGTLSNLPGVTSGIHAAYAHRYIRRVRFGSNNPLVEVCRKRGYPVVPTMHQDGSQDHTQMIVEFPIEAPAGTPIASEMSAVEQLENLVWAQRQWADQSVSATITYRPEELREIRKWMAKRYDSEVKAVSFLPYSGHGFVQAPYEPIEEEEYLRRAAKVNAREMDVHGASSLDDLDNDCIGGACPIR